MGISIEEFKHLNPKKLEWCYKGYKLKKEEEDRNSWQRWGDYGISALIFAIEHCLNGRKAQSKYIDKPIMERADIADNEKKFRSKEKRSSQDLWQCKLILNYHTQKRRNKHEFNRN